MAQDADDDPAAGRDDVVQLDRAQLRRLAHPLRTRLLAALRRGGPATASHLAEQLGTNSGATSYHLRQLAEVGLVDDAPELGAGRERYWQAAHAFTSWSVTEFEDDPDDLAAVTWLLGHHDRLTSSWRARWLSERDRFHPAWRDAAGSSDILLELTPAQLRSLLGELIDVVHRYRDGRSAAAADDDVEALPVMVLVQGFPHVESGE